MEAAKEVGRVTHFYSKISVAIVELKAPLAVGDRIRIVGSSTHLEQVADSIQIEHSDVKRATAGQSIGLKVTAKVRENDVVYR